MATYRGERTKQGCRVRVDGRLLPAAMRLRVHSPSGFEWGYGGSGPAQLALAILVEHYHRQLDEEAHDDEHAAADVKALENYQAFKFHTIARLQGDEWMLTSEQIDQALREISEEGRTPTVPNA